MIRLTLLIITTLSLSGCSNPFQSYFKYSANQKLIDAKGFKGKKRMPMYNKKYITKAQNNITSTTSTSNNEEEADNRNPYYDQDELRNYYQANRKMYEDMLEMNNNKKYWSKALNTKSKSEVTLDEVEKDNKKTEENKQIKSELAEIKKMLKKTMDDLSSVKNKEQIQKQADATNDLLNSILEPKVISGPCSAPNQTSPAQ